MDEYEYKVSHSFRDVDPDHLIVCNRYYPADCPSGDLTDCDIDEILQSERAKLTDSKPINVSMGVYKVLSRIKREEIISKARECYIEGLESTEYIIFYLVAATGELKILKTKDYPDTDTEELNERNGIFKIKTFGGESNKYSGIEYITCLFIDIKEILTADEYEKYQALVSTNPTDRYFEYECFEKLYPQKYRDYFQIKAGEYVDAFKMKDVTFWIDWTIKEVAKYTRRQVLKSLRKK